MSLTHEDILRLGIPLPTGLELGSHNRIIAYAAAVGTSVFAAALREAAKACEAERLVDPCKGEDEAYERAIDHCLQAIRQLAKPPG